MLKNILVFEGLAIKWQCTEKRLNSKEETISVIEFVCENNSTVSTYWVSTLAFTYREKIEVGTGQLKKVHIIYV